MAKGYSARNGFGGSAGMMRQQQQMQQKLARMQQDMEAAQKNVEESSFTASVGGGAVQATVSGKKQVTALTIQPDAVDPQGRADRVVRPCGVGRRGRRPLHTASLRGVPQGHLLRGAKRRGNPLSPAQRNGFPRR